MERSTYRPIIAPGLLAATLVGGLRPGSLRVHAPCNENGHGAGLGLPVAYRGTPPLPACPSGPAGAAEEQNKFPRRIGSLREGGGDGPGPGGTWFAGGQGEPPTGTQWKWGMAVLEQDTSRPARKYHVSPDRPVELFRRERPTPRALPGSAPFENKGEGPKVLDGFPRRYAERRQDPLATRKIPPISCYRTTVIAFVQASGFPPGSRLRDRRVLERPPAAVRSGSPPRRSGNLRGAVPILRPREAPCA